MTNDKDGKEINKPLAKPLATAAAVLGLVQGIFWTVGSILCICCHYGSIQAPQPVDSPEYYQLIYYIFLDSETATDGIISPRDFFIFMWFYLIFSAIWAVTSGTLLWAMIHDQWHLTKSLFGGWSAVTILISIVDIVLTGLLVSDYIYVSGQTSNSDIIVCYGIVMSLAARGYILLVINVIFAAIMMKFSIELFMQQNKETTMPFIHGYESNYTNSPWSNDSGKDFWATSPQHTTPKTDGGYDNRGFERSQSFFTPPVPTQNVYSLPPDNLYTPNSNSTYPSPAKIYNAVPSNKYNGIPNNNYGTPQNNRTPNNNYGVPQNNSTPNNTPTSFSEAIAQRTATIGRNKGRRSPPNHIPPPIIPDPDYTPPGSPNGLKSVLRSKSNYNRSPY